MSSSLLTKKRIAKAFKKQLASREFKKISVVDIMQEAGIRRQTFYNHFLDKYELLDWIFETELQEQVTDNLNYISGPKLLEELLYYLETNQSFYLQVFEIRGQNDFVGYLEAYLRILLEKLIDEYGAKEGWSVEEDRRRFLVDYHAGAWLQLIKKGLEHRPCQLHRQSSYLVELVLASVSV